MSQSESVRLGVIGIGNIAKQHITNVRSGQVHGCEISALCSRSSSTLVTELALPYFHDYRELIASGLCEAILIATPTYSHFEIASAALQAGLHVMIEKPIGLSVKEGEDLLALQQDDQILAVMLNQRADPLFTIMHDLIEQGVLGEICRTHWTMTNWFRPEIYFQVSDWRGTWRGEGGGLLLNQCIHNLDIFHWLCGMPRSVRAFCRFGRFHEIEVEDEVTAYLEYDNGASGLFVGSTGEAPGINRLDVIGDKGSLIFDGERLLLSENEPETSRFNKETRDMFGQPRSSFRDITPDSSCNQHAVVLGNFVRAILEDELLIGPAHVAISSLTLANSMLLSTWEQKTITLPMDKDRYQRALEQRIARSSFRKKSDVKAHIDMEASYR